MKRFAKQVAAVAMASVMMVGTSIGVLGAEPVRDAFETAGATVAWDGASRQIVITLEGRSIVLSPGSATALVDGRL